MSPEKKPKEKKPKSNEVCDTCRFMTSTLQGLRALTSREGYKHFHRDAISSSVKRGCSLCAILTTHQGYLAYDGYYRVFAEVEDTTTSGDALETEHPFNGQKIKRLLVNQSPRGLPFGPEVYAFTTIDDLAVKHVLHTQPLSIPVMKEIIIEKINERRARCQTEHKSCPLEVRPFLPKRVIDVGAEESDRSTALHISEPNEKAPYIALSYCWGGPQKVMTTTTTLGTYISALPKELPKSIQDAILVTRSLRFRYLWVDALCIIQDDDSDKTIEISNMGLIYKNATLTIAAASACSVKDGFLKDRPRLPMCQLPFYITDNSHGSIWLRHPDQERPNEPLDSRAWTLQESLLSPRILYYATKDLIWKCQEDKFVAVNETHNPYYTSLTERLPDAVFQTPENSDGAVQRTRTWSAIIDDYSGRKLTVPEDRLPALAGLARELQIVWKDDYFAGMWRSCLVKHLAWCSTEYSKRKPLTDYQSPGWSWVSVESQVMIREVQREEAELLDVSVTLVDKNSPFGQVCGGKLVLRAPVLPGGVDMDIERSFIIFGPDGKPELDSDCKFLLLGYLAKSQTIGLILRPTEDGAFMRVGHFTGGRRRGKSIPWPTNTLQREIVTIV